jgi:hypothetical protein
MDVHDMAARAAQELRQEAQGLVPAAFDGLAQEIAGASRVVPFGVSRQGPTMRAKPPQGVSQAALVRPTRPRNVAVRDLVILPTGVDP